jgi:hypothetical protein
MAAKPLLPDTKQSPLSADELLRKHGYAILSRPKTGEPVWRNRRGHPVRQTIALRTVATILEPCP